MAPSVDVIQHSDALKERPAPSCALTKYFMKKIRLPRGVWLYDPETPLGEPGGFGAVFLGRSEDGNPVAVKRLHLQAEALSHREMRIADELAGNEYSHVVPIFDSGQDSESDQYFVVMAQAERSLQDALIADGSYAEDQAVQILIQIAEGLRELGDIVHRDLKPPNVLFHDGKWKLTDFGIARFVEDATSQRTLKDCLSPPYAAPEQWKMQRATHATDIYALGCVGYALLQGSPPFVADTQDEYGRMHLTEDPPILDAATPRMRSLLANMLRKIPQSRPGIKRVMIQLDKMSEPRAIGNGASLLAEADAQVSEQISQREAEEEALRQAEEERQTLANEAIKILVDLSNRFCAHVSSQSPTVSYNPARHGVPSISHSPARYGASSMVNDELRLGNGELMIRLPAWDHVIDKKAFQTCGWDIITGGEIRVSSDSYRWSESLWYGDIDGSGEYRWYQVGYMGITQSAQQPYEPFSLGPGRDADFAAAAVMHSYQLATPVTPIDGENFEEFCDYWMQLFAKAAKGELRYPKSLPIRREPPQ